MRLEKQNIFTRNAQTFIEIGRGSVDLAQIAKERIGPEKFYHVNDLSKDFIQSVTGISSSDTYLLKEGDYEMFNAVDALEKINKNIQSTWALSSGPPQKRDMLWHENSFIRVEDCKYLSFHAPTAYPKIFIRCIKIADVEPYGEETFPAWAIRIRRRGDKIPIFIQDIDFYGVKTKHGDLGWKKIADSYEIYGDTKGWENAYIQEKTK